MLLQATAGLLGDMSCLHKAGPPRKLRALLCPERLPRRLQATGGPCLA